MTKQSREDLVNHLRRQLRHLRNSARLFDEGDESEAARLATTIRVLVYNRGQSVALLKQLGEQHKMKFLDTWRPLPPELSGVLAHRFDFGLAVTETDFDSGTVRYKAPLDDFTGDEIKGPQPFRTWWDRQILTDERRQRFTRGDCVLFMAHKDGGAHVDPELPVDFHSLTRLNSLGWSWGVGEGPQAPLGDPLPTNIRQVAFEVEQSIVTQLGPLLGRFPSEPLAG